MPRQTLQLRMSGFRVVRPLTIEVTEGPDQPSQLGPLSFPIRIGAAEGNEVVLNDPTVSSYHCTLEEGPEGIIIRDTGSTNGVWIGGHRVLVGVISETTQITLGRTTLDLQLGDSRPEPEQTITDDKFGRLIGRSPMMQRFLQTLQRVAPTRASVLIEGETGTGKELAARSLHEEGPQSDAPFVTVDFTATQSTPIESVLFGHEKDAFEGAQTAQTGAFEKANGGVLFLNEVGELPLELQPTLLRALETQAITPVGATQPVPVQVRVIAATHRNLRRMVNEGTFRQDLYFRLAVCTVQLPTLRDRREDIGILANNFFLEALELVEEAPSTPPTIAPAALAWLERQSWPGNVRELRHIVQRAVILGQPEDIQAGQIQNALEQAVSEVTGTPAVRVSLQQAKRTFERSYLLELLHRHNGNRTAAAQEADIHVKSLQRLVRRHGLKGEIP